MISHPFPHCRRRVAGAMFLACAAAAAPGRDAAADAAGADAARIADGLQRRYAAAKAITGEFRQTYRAPGIEQEESGTFALMRPGLMRWDYREPEIKLFVVDGKEAFLYLPAERQVQVQAMRPSDLHNTPLQFLVGGLDIRGNFDVRPEPAAAGGAGTVLLRLTPRPASSDYQYLVLECDPATFDLRRILIREAGGNTSEFELGNLQVHPALDKSAFRFRMPKGVEVVRLDDK